MNTYTSTASALAQQWDGTVLGADEFIEGCAAVDVTATYHEQREDLDEENGKYDVTPAHVRVYLPVGGFVIVLVDQWIVISDTLAVGDDPAYRVYSDERFQQDWKLS